jgi:uncharacterized protein (DUF1015 family)
VAEFVAFRGLRYTPVAGPLSDLICPPYDVISDAQRDALYARNPNNFVRVEYPREEGDAKYAQAAETLRTWMERDVLRPDPVPAMYLHEHEFEVSGQRLLRRGLFAALRLYEQSEAIVLPHELTFPKAKADRLALLRATRANTSAVFGMFSDTGGLMAYLASRPTEPAGEAVVGADRHRLLRLWDPGTAARVTGFLRDARVYIADGHHRYETALNYLKERRDVGPRAPERYILAYVCALEDPGLRIFATHRIVRGGDAALRDAVVRSFNARTIDRGALGDIQPGIAIVRGGHFESLELRPGVDLSSLPGAWRSLPVAIAEELLVKPSRDAGAEITYEHDTDRAIAAADSGATTILLRSVDPATLRAVADAGQRLPQKTTYFYPKVPAGLVVRSLDV